MECTVLACADLLSFPPSLSLQLVTLLILVAALCDLFYTIYQHTQGRVPSFHYVTPVVLASTMVCSSIH